MPRMSAPDECNEVGDFTAEIVPCCVCMRFFKAKPICVFYAKTIGLLRYTCSSNKS